MNPAISIDSLAPEPRHAPGHSKLGLTSLLIALLCPLLMGLLFLVLLLLQVRIENEAFTYFLLMLSGSIAGIVAHLLGVIMAIVGLRRPADKKVLSVLGIIFNAIPLILAAVVCVLFVVFLLNPFPLGPK